MTRRALLYWPCATVITYRLQGLDGEATEDMVDKIEEDAEDGADPEEEFAITALIREGDGLAALLSLVPLLSDAAGGMGAAAPMPAADAVPSLGSLTVSRTETGALLMRVLGAAAQLRLNRRALLAAGALPVLLREASRIFSVHEEAARERGNELLLLVERLLQEEATAVEERAAAGPGHPLSLSLSQPVYQCSRTHSPHPPP